MMIPFSDAARAFWSRRRMQKIMLIKLPALVLLLGGCAAPLSQVPPGGMPAAVPAPQVAIGDAWTYRVHDAFTRIPRGDQRYQVTTVGADRIEVTGPVERGDGIQLYDREWNWLKRPATNLQTFEYSPAYPAFAFPLTPGKRWHARVTARDPADGRRFPVWVDGAVLGWERVKVPAGEFDALKIERIVYIEYFEYAVRGRSVIREHEWYAPAVKQSVKREARSSYLSYLAGAAGDSGFVRVRGGDRNDGGPRYVLDDWLVYELTTHSVR
jgi:hypothetical protein